MEFTDGVIEFNDGASGQWLILVAVIAALALVALVMIALVGLTADFRVHLRGRRLRRLGYQVEYEVHPPSKWNGWVHVSRVVNPNGQPVTEWRSYSPTVGRNEVWHLGR